MKHVVIQRAWSDHRVTLGMLTIVGVRHEPIYTLENPLRETIVDSRISDGEFECIPYSGTKFKDVYLLKDVPERTDILIHAGNFESDTRGCILVGLSAASAPTGEPMILESRQAMRIFRELIGDESFILTLLPEGTLVA